MEKEERTSILRDHLKKRGYTHCKYCKRKLSNVVSMFRRAGPVCYKRNRQARCESEKFDFTKKS